MNGRTLQRFSEAVLTLHDCRKAPDFGASLLRAVQLLFDATSHVVNWIGPTKFEDVSVRSADIPREASLELFNAHLHQHPLHPLIEGARRGESPRPARWSDRTTLREFRQTALYHDFFRYTQTRHQFAVTLKASEGAILGLSFNRDRRDFGDEDLRLMEMFVPHIRQALDTLSGRREVEMALALQALNMKGQAALVVAENGAVLHITEGAHRLLRDYFSATAFDALPAEIAAWLNRNPAPGEEFVHGRLDRRLICTCGEAAPWQGAEFSFPLEMPNAPAWVRCVNLREESQGDTLPLLQGLGLTPREAEVLRWMTEGKRNSEIAIILGAGVRTVDKHRDHLFAKLGVENRSGAVAIALAAIHGQHR